MLQQLLQDIQALGLLDWVVTLTALIYVILSARNHPACWPFGIVSCALWAYASYAYYGLYADALLQVFYVVMGFVGLYAWLRGGKSEEQVGKSVAILPISKASPDQHLIYISVALVLGLLFGYLFSHTSAAATYYDSLTTSFSVVATVLLVRRRLYNWLYWIIIDLAYAGLYYSRGAILFALLMLVYTVIAYFAYRHWRKLITTVE